MNATTVVSLISALATAFIAVGGVIFTQHRADRRAAHERAEQREQERQRWAREDSAQTYEHRRDAYMEFLRTHAAYERAHAEPDPDRGPPEPEDMLSLIDAHEQVAVFGTLDAQEAAEHALREMTDRILGDASPDWEVIQRFRTIVRRDLGVPDRIDEQKDTVK